MLAYLANPAAGDGMSVASTTGSEGGRMEAASGTEEAS